MRASAPTHRSPRSPKGAALRRILLLGTGVWFGACSGTESSAVPCEGAQVYAAYSDYKSARVGGLSASGQLWDTGGADLGQDVTLAVHDGKAFLLARDFDTLFVLREGCGLPERKVSLRRSASSMLYNPQDAVQSSDGALWIANYGTPGNVGPSLLRIGADGVRTEPQLSNLDDDENPQATFVHRYVRHDGREEIVSWFARLDDKNYPRVKSTARIVYVDADTRLETRRTDTEGRNLFGQVDVHAGFAYAAAPGDVDDAAEPVAGIERLNLELGTSKLLHSERALGGSPTSVRAFDECLAAVVVDASTTTKRTTLVTIAADAPGAVAQAAIPATEGYQLTGLAWSNGVLYVGDRQGNRGSIRTFRRQTGCALQEVLPAIATPGLPFALAAAVAPPRTN